VKRRGRAEREATDAEVSARAAEMAHRDYRLARFSEAPDHAEERKLVYIAFMVSVWWFGCNEFRVACTEQAAECS
jgi:hypothetical protein